MKRKGEGNVTFPKPQAQEKTNGVVSPFLKGKKKIIFENITWLMFKRRHPYKLELIHWEEKLNRQILMVYFVHFMDNRVKNV